MADITDVLKTEREENRRVVEVFLKNQSDTYRDLSPLFGPLLDRLYDYSLLAGKWHRPALAILAYKLTTQNAVTPAIRQAAAGLELLHRYLLIHDDIIDRDLVRHGGPTMEKHYADRFAETYVGKPDDMYSKGMALVAGDLLASFAYQMVIESGVSAETTVALITAFNQLLAETTAGWQLQTEQNHMAIEAVTEDEFMRGMELVSAQYSFVWPLRIGQILAGRKKADQWSQDLETYGRHVGLAFQIQDDILGMFGTKAETGKPVGHDYREGKKTLLILKAYQKASPNDQTFLKETLGNKSDAATLEKARAIMTQTLSLKANQALATDHTHIAKKSLESLPQSAAKDILYNLAEYMIHRTQ